MSVLIWVSNCAFQRSNRICSQDQHAQAQHWLRQAQLMHAQHWPRTQSRSRQGGGCPPLPCSHLGPRPMLSMHELSLSMPEPMLSLSMLILATYPNAALEGTIRNQIKADSTKFKGFRLMPPTLDTATQQDISEFRWSRMLSKKLLKRFPCLLEQTFEMK